MYGSSDTEVRLLRNLTHYEGKLREGILGPTGKPMMPFSAGAPVDCRRDLTESGVDCFLAGDIRANEQVLILFYAPEKLVKTIFFSLFSYRLFCRSIINETKTGSL